jgi:hypothetical protein
MQDAAEHSEDGRHELTPTSLHVERQDVDNQPGVEKFTRVRAPEATYQPRP